MRQFLENYGLFIALALICVCPVFGDGVTYSPERPGISTDDPIETPKDLTGNTVKCPRVRAVHSEDVSEEGATAYLLKLDPWLGFQRGRELFLREFTKDDGVFGESGRFAGPTLEDETTKLMTRGHVSSCMMCHNVPFRDAGSGTTIFKNGGMGRNTPHLFGAGLVEMLGWQTRLKLLDLADKNRNGFIDKSEADHLDAIVPVDQGDGRVLTVNFGKFGDADGDGKPDLNTVCFVWYVDKDGKRISWARSLDDDDVAGYNFEVQVFGWGHGRAVLSNRIPITSTIRAFSAQAFDNHAGMQARDNTLNEEPDKDGLALASINGAQQFYTGRTRDRGRVVDKKGISLDDPDRDGVVEEISEGDLDLVEFYLLNHPRPGKLAQNERRINGKELLNTIGCTACHIQNWKIEARNTKAKDYTRRYPGDRRFFDFEAAFNPASKRLEGKLNVLADKKEKGRRTIFQPSGNSFVVEEIYTDFLHHDLGPNFHQVQFDGSVIKAFKTAPLWGVASTAPYGHDGASLTLDSVILRHGGEAKTSTAAYKRLSEEDKLALLEYLRSLTLYSVDKIPGDINNDGKIAQKFIVQGKDTGYERLNPEWLFSTPGKIEGMVTNPNGDEVKSFALLNFRKAYGLDLKYLIDENNSGFPDALSRRGKIKTGYRQINRR